MTKGLEVWYLVKKYLEKEHHKIVKEDIPLKTVEGMPLDIIEKELEALEILIRKNINLWIFKNTNSYRAYIEGCYLHEQCSKEEYDSLKLLKESERV